MVADQGLRVARTPLLAVASLLRSSSRDLEDTNNKLKAMMKQLTTLEWKRLLKNTKPKLRLFKPKRPNMRHYFASLSLSSANLKLASGETRKN